jgi:hypothetical protein
MAQKPATKKVIITRTITNMTTTKTFPCGCAADCTFKAAETDLRLVLGRPYINANARACNCKVHYKCANFWAAALCRAAAL